MTFATVPRFFQFSSVKYVYRYSLVRTYASALFISDKVACENFVILKPHFDFDERFSDVRKMKREFEARGISLDVDDMKKTWDMYKYVVEKRSELEVRKIEISNAIKDLSKKQESTKEDEAEATRLKLLGRVVREDLKNIKQAVWSIENTIVPQVLKLPNVLEKDTPIFDPFVSSVVGNAPSDAKRSTSHIEIGRNLGLLQYTNPMNYYLVNEAALFELGVLRLAGIILASNNMLRVAGCDFSRSLIVEAAGLDHENPNDSFILKDDAETKKNPVNRNHLLGGASLVSFLAMHTKQLVNPKQFPLKYFATGRQYAPCSNDTAFDGLFSVCQASAVQIFVAVKDYRTEEYRKELDNLVNIVRGLYDVVCDHYRVIVRPAKELRAWECLCIAFELWSPHCGQYIEVGHLSLCGEYFSKRLLFGYQTPKGRNFPSVISGTVLSVPKLLGCLLERDSQKFEIPNKVQEHIPTLVNKCTKNDRSGN